MKEAKNKFSEYLADKKIKNSKPREQVLDIFLKTEKHLSTDELYRLVRTKYSNIGYATVYRALKLIIQSGLAEEVDLGDGVVRFEHKYGHEHHDHLVCIQCGRFIEAVHPEIEKLQNRLAQRHKFIPLRHKMEIYGLCQTCRGGRR